MATDGAGPRRAHARGGRLWRGAVRRLREPRAPAARNARPGGTEPELEGPRRRLWELASRLLADALPRSRLLLRDRAASGGGAAGTRVHRRARARGAQAAEVRAQRRLRPDGVRREVRLRAVALHLEPHVEGADRGDARLVRAGDESRRSATHVVPAGVAASRRRARAPLRGDAPDPEARDETTRSGGSPARTG